MAVTESGAPRAPRAMVLWRPPELRGRANGSRDSLDSRDSLSIPIDAARSEAPESLTRRSPMVEAADVVADLVRRRASCLCFVTARALTERLCRDVRERLVRSGDQALALRVDSYRGGYGAEERRLIETKLRKGELLALITTSALEMGIDVGALDATVHVGVPATASSMWQQAGRAGRRGASSVAIVISRETPLDAYYTERPKELWHRAPEPAVVDPANVAIPGAAPAVRGARSAHRRAARHARLRRRRVGSPPARDGGGDDADGDDGDDDRAVPDAVPARAEARARADAFAGGSARRRTQRRVARRDAAAGHERSREARDVPRGVPPRPPT